MQSLLDNCCYHYIIIDNDRYRNELMITNIGNFTESTDYTELINFTECNDKTEDVTHMVCTKGIQSYALLSFPLKNLKYLELKTSMRNLSKINLSFCPNLKILVLNITQINNKFLHNLSLNMEI